MGKNLIKILGAGIIALSFGSKVIPKVNASTFFDVFTRIVSVDDPNHPGLLETKHELYLWNYSGDGERFSGVKIEKPELGEVVYAVDVPEGWVYVMDPNGISFSSTAPEYDIPKSSHVRVDLWSPYHSVDSLELVAVAETRDGELTNNYSLFYLPNNPEWLSEPADLGTLAEMGANWLYDDCSVDTDISVGNDSCYRNDYNGDGFVGMSDFGYFAGNWVGDSVED